jgi:hypothetical protein
MTKKLSFVSNWALICAYQFTFSLALCQSISNTHFIYFKIKFFSFLAKSYNLQLYRFSLFLSLSIGYEPLVIFLSNFSAIDCPPCGIVFILTLTVIILCGITTDYKYDNSVYTSMPVTTRSKSRLLQSSCHEPSQVCLTCSPMPSTTIPIIYNSSPQNLSQFQESSTVTPTISQALTQEYLISPSSLLFTDSLSVKVPSNNLEISNLKLDNSVPVDTVSNFVTTRVSFCHNSSCLQISTMESDCKEIDTSSKPDPPDLQQLFAALSA